MNINNTVKSILFKTHCLLIYKYKKQKIKLITELRNVQMKKSLLLLSFSRQFLTNQKSFIQRTNLNCNISIFLENTVILKLIYK